MISLGYHEITSVPAMSGFTRPGAEPYRVAPVDFAMQLDLIGAGCDTPELVTNVDLRVPGRHLLLTFDDGGKSALLASDELSERGWRGHFFISTSHIGRRTFLSPSEILDIARAGHGIGSHSHTHPDIFREQTRGAMLAEWRTSCDILSDLLGTPCIMASLPGGDLSDDVLESAASARLAYLFTSEPVLYPQWVGDCCVLGRVPVRRRDDPLHVFDLASGHGWRRERAVRWIKNIARSTMPGMYRRYVRRTTLTGSLDDVAPDQ